jgi:hypothetical protein
VIYGRTYSYRYRCWESINDENRCISFSGYDLDQYILREVFKVLKAPPLDILKSALEASRSEEQTRLKWIESERGRLKHEERSARERADLTRGRLECVYEDALEKLEKVLQERKQFEKQIVTAPLVPTNDASEEELEKLCRIASEVPRLWQHPGVTHKEKKDILRCVIDDIVVAVTKEKIDATILWKSGGQTTLTICRYAGRGKLICELHAQGLTVSEIIAHLAAPGESSTWQPLKCTRARIYKALRKQGLKPKRFSTAYLSLRQKANELRREGRSVQWIADHFNAQGFASASGKSWSANMVYSLCHYELRGS